MVLLLATWACAPSGPPDPLGIRCPEGAARTVEVRRAWCVLEDEDGRERKHGPMIELSEAGVPERRVTYADGKYEGPYQTWHRNGQLAVNGTYAAGQRDGPWEAFHRNGQRRLHGAYADGRPVGPWRAWHENGELAFSGRVDESVTTRRRSSDDREVNGFEPGAWAHWTEAGTLRMVGAVGTEGREGLWLEWYEEGPFKSASFYVGGEEDGPFVSYRLSGGLAEEGTYAAGQKVGRWREWSQDGTLTRDVTCVRCGGVRPIYADGVHQEWHGDGKLAARHTCAATRCDVERYDRTGALASRGVTVDGEIQGVWQTFCRDGRLESAQMYVDGREEGPGERHSCSASARRRKR